MSDVKVVVVTYASDPKNEGLVKLSRTLSAWGWEFRPIIGPWRGFESKLQGVHSKLPDLAAEGFTHVLFTDAYDTVCVGPPDAVLPYCTDKMLVSCEKACWPDANLASQYPSSSRSPWCHVNSGGYIGPIPVLYDVLMNATGDDQLWLTRKYLSDWNIFRTGAGYYEKHIKRDDLCEVFQTTGHTVLPWATWDVTFDKVHATRRVANKVTNTQPLFIHGNGRAVMEWLDDHLQLGTAYSFPEAPEKTTPTPISAPPAPIETKPDGPFHWSQIPGFGEHGYAAFYEQLVKEAPEGATIVEVGCYHGRSLAHLALTAAAANKRLKVCGVDHCDGPSAQLGRSVINNLNKCGLSVLHYVRGSEVPTAYPVGDGSNIVSFYEMPSVEASERFLNDHLWCVFIDDGHLHEEVEAGIDAWMPKVRPDGLLAGHDAIMYCVWETVYAKLPGVVHDPNHRDCWFCHKQTPLTGVDIHASVRIQFEHGDAMFGYGVGDKRNDGAPAGSPLMLRVANRKTADSTD